MIRVVHPGSDPDVLPIPDPGVKKAPDPGSATLANTPINSTSDYNYTKLKDNVGRGEAGRIQSINFNQSKKGEFFFVEDHSLLLFIQEPKNLAALISNFIKQIARYL
jgi:hypothetical protein